MGGSDGDEVERKLTKRMKKTMKIDDKTNDWEQVKSGFLEHWENLQTTSLHRSGQVIYSDITCDQERIFCGLTNGSLNVIDPSRLTEAASESPRILKHPGLSCTRCSKVSPEVIYSSSSVEGNVLQWDLRQNVKTPAQTFEIGKGVKIGGNTDGPPGNKSKTKPILQFDISQNDQIICAGTELVDDDSYLLFWDVRSSKLLGAYWESHSDDVTAVRFHPSQTHALTTGSTDGLLNVFNLLEPSEDQALLYSLNTESSVESLNWNCLSDSSNSKTLPSSSITCVTHTNEVQIWNADSGDQFIHFNRNQIANAMMINNPDAVYVTGTYQTPTSTPYGILTCSLSGSCSRYINIMGNELKPLSLFADQQDVIQTAQFLTKANRWITFDEDGSIKTWTLGKKLEEKESLIIKGDKKAKGKHKLKPYSREKSTKNN